MTETGTIDALSAVVDNLRGTRDAMTVGRVFGQAYREDGVTVIPVARVSGGAGGGGGEGTGADEVGKGFGSGFGLGARPVGVYEIRDGEVSWSPAIDVNRAIRGGQALAGLVVVCGTLVLLGRRRSSS